MQLIASPPPLPPPAKLVCNVNIVHRVASKLYSVVVLYNCIVLYPTYAEREGALGSSIVLHSCLPDAYKQRYKIKIKHQGTV
jgi:hypothetical protein